MTFKNITCIRSHPQRKSGANNEQDALQPVVYYYYDDEVAFWITELA